MSREETNVNRLRKGLGGCTLFLRRNGDFPLDAPTEIAAYGSGVRHTLKGGTGSGEVNSRYFVTVEEGLEKAGFTVTSKSWIDAYDEVLVNAHQQFVKDIKAEAKKLKTMPVLLGMGAVMPQPEYTLPLDAKGDVAVYVVTRICGEGNDRKAVKGDLYLSDTEIREINECHKKYPKFLLVLNVGSVIDLQGVEEVENVLLLSQLGVETGSVVADVLLGKADPSGKLTTTWAKGDDYVKAEFADPDDTRYNEGIYVGYRYFDSIGKKALYPFGYGKSFTDFAVKARDVTVDKDAVTVRAEVTNTGKHSGREVVQVYLSSPKGKLDKAYQDLAGFVKTSVLSPEEKGVFEVTFSLKDLASYDEEKAQYLLEKGDYIVRVGNSSADTEAAAVLRLSEDVVVKQVANKMGRPDFRDLVIEREDDKTDAPVIEIDPKAFETETVRYGFHPEIEEKLRGLKDEELAYLNIGGFDPKGGLASVIGNASTKLAGAAGESTSMVKGMPVTVMSDGPAGIRVAKEYYEDEKGQHALGASLPATLMDFMPKILTFFMNRKPKLKKGTVIKNHYATAIPIGTASAQSWDIEFARDCGDIVGSEMEEFGVHFWLAPALNIHRSILCGRNFEYYSEDPLISGLMAAYVTKGVQAHKGCAVTIKHYAANNQETNRYFSNSLVSERALREIYLRGFAIAIRESKPLGLMSSYNLINGVHTSESHDLITDILRNEYGYEGVVMTDWVVSGMSMKRDNKHSEPNAAKVAAAGHQLFMPGAKKDHKEVMDGLQSGLVTREQLLENASVFYRVAEKLVNKL